MSVFAQQLIKDDFLWRAISSNLPSKQRRSGTNFININCPMCASRGESPDTKMRCGIKNDVGVGVYCFNCGFATRWQPGELLNKYMVEFLERLGIPGDEVKRINHRAFQYRSVLTSSPEALALIPHAAIPSYPSRSLPEGAKSFEEWANGGCTDPDFIEVANYVFNRGDEIASSTKFFWTPSTKNDLNRRVIVPCYHEGKIVGWTARAANKDIKVRYYSDIPTDLVFNNHSMLAQHRKYVIVVEGIFDALAIDGVSTLGAKLSPVQATWIKSYGKKVIVVPDFDRRGHDMINLAVKHEWSVSFPRTTANRNNLWDEDVKDAADAVKKYGRLYTTWSILESVVDDPRRIEQLSKRII